MSIFAIMHEGHVNVSREPGVHRGLIFANSYWETEAEAQTTLDRVYPSNFGRYAPARRWITEITDENYDHALTSHPEHNAPEHNER